MQHMGQLWWFILEKSSIAGLLEIKELATSKSTKDPCLNPGIFFGQMEQHFLEFQELLKFLTREIIRCSM